MNDDFTIIAKLHNGKSFMFPIYYNSRIKKVRAHGYQYIDVDNVPPELNRIKKIAREHIRRVLGKENIKKLKYEYSPHVFRRFNRYLITDPITK